MYRDIRIMPVSTTSAERSKLFCFNNYEKLFKKQYEAGATVCVSNAFYRNSYSKTKIDYLKTSGR